MKILSTIYKEFLLLIRDPGGMALIFIMPLALVIVMALVQDAPFRDYQELKLDVLLVDMDADSLGNKIRKSFQATGQVNLVEERDSLIARQKVHDGEYKAAIILEPQVSATLRRKTRQLIARVFANFGMDADTSDNADVPTIRLKVLVDPAIKANYRQSLASGIEKIIANVQTTWLLDELQDQLSEGKDSARKIKFDLSQIATVDQSYAATNKFAGLMLNSVQHNVPAWTMFAMFFILYPLAGNFINEREDGSMLRLRLIAGSQFAVITGKFFFYFFVCLLQFVMMICIGIFVMPLLGLNQLVLGGSSALILLTACCVAMAATGYGTLIAVYFRTAQQALSFGSISVVILSAIGGVWVPIYVMPEILQTISRFSPMSWGLESFNDLFLRQASLGTILPNILRLLGFALVTLMASVFIHNSRTVS
ncbi:ABC transporter permease [Chryseolinea sp. T2]|uniref:ABC transporter permease n=1 Tax=Chryseolinea sp. T2 TaxID=3129255 RepID=UPI003077EAEE